jgi:adenylate kinase
VNIILFGPPGAGKGTQAKYLIKRLEAFQISTGDLLRKEITNNTEIGKKISVDIKEGKFVSDDIVNKLIKDLIFDPQKKNNFIFDGYPRSLSQAKNLDKLLIDSDQKIDLILFLKVQNDTILKRIEIRKIIENRSDDNLNTIVRRYDVYMQTTKPVLDFYSKNQNFKEIDGSLEIDEITRKIDTFINV